MALKGFTFYRTYCDVAEELRTEKEQKDLFFAIVRYLMYDDDIEEKLSKNVRIAFKCLKSNLKTSRSRAESGKAGMESRYNKTLTNEQQTPNKNLTSLSSSLSLSSRRDGAGSGLTKPAPSLGEDVTFPCPHCHAPATGYWSESLGKYSARCSDPLCGADFVISAEAVAAAIGGEAS